MIKRTVRFLFCGKTLHVGFQVVLVIKNPPANAGDIKDAGSIPGKGRAPGRGHSNPLQYSCLKNSMDGGMWRATVHRVAKSQTQLKQISMAWHKPLHVLGIHKMNYSVKILREKQDSHSLKERSCFHGKHFLLVTRETGSEARMISFQMCRIQS